MNDHNLDDLIIDTATPKNQKTKSLLTIVALLIIVLIAGIILTKTLLRSPQNDTLAFEENISEMIAPELKLQENVEVSTPKEVVSSPVVAQKKTTEEKVEPKSSEVAEEKSVVIEESVEPAAVEKKDAPKESIEPTVAQTKPDLELPPTEESTHNKTAESVTPKALQPKATVKKQTPKRSTPETVSMGKYYVQVGSFRENPSPRFLTIIKSNGFAYHITKPDNTGYKKLLIGPYKTRAEVDKARNTIRDRIHKSAFVVQK